MGDRVLFVDDEPNILQGFQRNLRNEFDVSVAQSGQAAIDLIKESEQFSVIVSDMQMPQMDGSEFLAMARKLSPESIRLMLTGNSDQKTAVQAINQGDIFRFVNKPCPHEIMSRLLKVAVNQYNLGQVEKEILGNTLKGSIQALGEVLSLTKPNTYGRTCRLRSYFNLVLENLRIESDWELESLIHLSQVGYLVLPDSLIEKFICGVSLSDADQAVFEKHPEAASNLLRRIPRLENIAEALRYQMKGFDGSGLPKDGHAGSAIPFGGRLLKVITDFDKAEMVSSPELAAVKLRQDIRLYDPELLEALLKTVSNEDGRETQIIKMVNVRRLRPGMVIAADFYTDYGVLLMSKGHEITQFGIERLHNFGANGMPEKDVSVFAQAIVS